MITICLSKRRETRSIMKLRVPDDSTQCRTRERNNTKSPIPRSSVLLETTPHSVQNWKYIAKHDKIALKAILRVVPRGPQAMPPHRPSCSDIHCTISYLLYIQNVRYNSTVFKHVITYFLSQAFRLIYLRHAVSSKLSPSFHAFGKLHYLSTGHVCFHLC